MSIDPSPLDWAFTSCAVGARDGEWPVFGARNESQKRQSFGITIAERSGWVEPWRDEPPETTFRLHQGIGPIPFFEHRRNPMPDATTSQRSEARLSKKTSA